MALVLGRNTTVGSASGGTLVVTKAPNLMPGGGWTNAGNYGAAPGAGGGVLVQAAGSIPLAGNKAPVDIKSTIPKGDIAGAVIGCTTGGVIGCAATAIPLAVAWLSSSGTRINPDTKQLEREDKTACTIGPCFEYNPGGTDEALWRRTQQAACEAGISSNAWSEVGWTITLVSVTGNTCNLKYTGPQAPDGVMIPGTLSFREAAPQSPTWYPATPQEVKDALIAAGAPPPAIVPELADNGIDWNRYTSSLKTPELSGPAVIPGTKTTTVNADGSTTVKTEETPVMYQGNRATAGNTTVTETTTNTDGTQRSQTTTTIETSGEPTPEEEQKDPCDEHPDRIGCIEIDTPEGSIPRQTKDVSFTAEDPFSGGQCPADVYTELSTVGGQRVKIIDWQTFCGYAIPLRAIVLALAAVTALFIIMPGGARE